jgi:signal transduction histidine kinase
VQELLTNARRHAPGAATTLDLDWDDTMLTITATTPAVHGAGDASPGGGHGLAGMRERVTEAGGTMAVRDGPSFEVVLRLPGWRGMCSACWWPTTWRRYASVWSPCSA